MKKLQHLAELHKTDKAEHGYCDVYEKHLNHLRNQQIKILEIGVFYGASLRMWRDYFPNAIIHGIDLNIQRCGNIENVFLHHIDVGDTTQLEKFCLEHGPFDLVIDDASHTMKHQQKTFNCIWPLLSNDGIYIIEDLHTSFFPKLDGHSANAIEEHNKTTTYKMVEMLKERRSWSGRYTKQETYEHLLQMVEKVTIWVRKPANFSHELTSNDNSATCLIKKNRK